MVRALTCTAVLILASCCLAEGLQFTGTVPKDWPTSAPAPLCIDLPAGSENQPIQLAWVNVRGGSSGAVAAWVEPADAINGTPARAWALWAAGAEDAGQPVQITLGDRQSPPRHAFEVKADGPAVNVVQRGRKILSYYHGEPDAAWKYPHTSFIHPIYGLDGEVLTQFMPVDHLHHRGLFWSWVRMEAKGKDLGEWWQPREIAVKPDELQTQYGTIFARLAADHTYVHKPKAGGPAEPFLTEHVVCRVFTPTDRGQAVDVDLTLTALVDGFRLGGTTTLNKGYGGMTLRFCDLNPKDRSSVRIVADGKDVSGKDLNHAAARWVDWTNRFPGPDGKPLDHYSGAALMVHPTHPPLPAAPPDWITRPYGPIGVCYPGLEMAEIPRDKPLRLKYRLLIHRNDPWSADVDRQYAAYAGDFHWKQD